MSTSAANNTQPRKIILDCDPGHDDAIAMLLAWGNPNLELLAVTTVAGNQTLEKVTKNAQALARVGGITGVPFAAGAHRPLVGPQLIPDEIHGESGLDGPQLPEAGVELEDTHAVDLIAQVIEREEPGTVTLVPTGAQPHRCETRPHGYGRRRSGPGREARSGCRARPPDLRHPHGCRTDR